MELRWYQREAIDSLYSYWQREKGNPLIVAPCGAGKSIIIAQFIKEAMQYPGTRILMMTHRQELLEQDEAELRGIWPDAPTGFFSAGLRRKDRNAPILFAGIQSVWDKLHTMDPFDLVIIDEAHLVPRKQASQYGHAMKTLRQMRPSTRYVGLTATDYRLDSGRLTEGDDALFDAVTYEIPVRTLIDEGHLCEVVGKRGVHVADLSGVKKRAGEFVAKQAEAAFDTPELVREACAEIVAYGNAPGARRRAWLVFSSGVEHAEHVRDEIRAHGESCEVVHGGIPKKKREETIQQFKAGELRCLVNVDVLTVGFNAPICDMGVLLRATASTALYVQIVGRLMRTYPGKHDALLLDYGGNVERHGPIDKVRVKKPGEGGGEAPIKDCPQCFSLVAAGSLECPDCGYQFPAREPKHEKTAFDGAIMSHQEASEWVAVDSVTYRRWEKPGKPDSVRVDYRCGLNVYKDWWCPEHGGKATQMTAMKFSRMGEMCPRSTDELLAIADELPKPSMIRVHHGKDHPSVESAHYPEKEPANA